MQTNWLKVAIRVLGAFVFLWGYSCADEPEARTPIAHLDRMYQEKQAGTWAPMDTVLRDTLDRRITSMRAAIKNYEER